MIEITGLNKVFNPGSPDEVHALRDINLYIGEHEFVTVIGTNGSGKSTLLSAIAGNIMPDSGTIRINGRDVTRQPDFKRAKFIARVFQNPFLGTAPEMTIAENLLMAWFRGRKRYPVISLKGKLKAIFREQLDLLDMQLSERLNNIIGTLSGGQRQAVTLLMAVMQAPGVLLLDEHTAALDPKTGSQVLRLTRKFIETDRLTTLMVTHSMKQALEMGSRIIMMHNGRIIEDMGPDEKRSLTIEILLNKFDDIRKREKLTPERIISLKQLYL